MGIVALHPSYGSAHTTPNKKLAVIRSKKQHDPKTKMPVSLTDWHYINMRAFLLADYSGFGLRGASFARRGGADAARNLLS